MMTPKRFGIRDAKRPSRERETLISEITRLVNRIKACLVGCGVRGCDPILRKAAARLEKFTTPERVRLPPLPPPRCFDMVRLRFLGEQIRSIEKARVMR